MPKGMSRKMKGMGKRGSVKRRSVKRIRMTKRTRNARMTRRSRRSKLGGADCSQYDHYSHMCDGTKENHSFGDIYMETNGDEFRTCSKCEYTYRV